MTNCLFPCYRNTNPLCSYSQSWHSWKSNSIYTSMPFYCCWEWRRRRCRSRSRSFSRNRCYKCLSRQQTGQNLVVFRSSDQLTCKTNSKIHTNLILSVAEQQRESDWKRNKMILKNWIDTQRFILLTFWNDNVELPVEFCSSREFNQCRGDNHEHSPETQNQNEGSSSHLQNRLQKLIVFQTWLQKYSLWPANLPVIG